MNSENLSINDDTLKSLHSIIDSTCDDNSKQFYELFDVQKKYDLIFNDQTSMIISQTNNINISANYITIGVYDPTCGLFTWSWNNMITNKNKKIIKIKEYISKLEKYIEKKTFDDTEYLEKIHYYLSNDIIHISLKNLNILEKMCMYIIHGKGIIREVYIPSDKKRKYYTSYLIIDIIGT
jgi:hypothetical protein